MQDDILLFEQTLNNVVTIFVLKCSDVKQARLISVSLPRDTIETKKLFKLQKSLALSTRFKVDRYGNSEAAQKAKQRMIQIGEINEKKDTETEKDEKFDGAHAATRQS